MFELEKINTNYLSVSDTCCSKQHLSHSKYRMLTQLFAKFTTS